MGALNRFFIFCSGVEQSILKQTSTENNKFAGIGATVFFTGVFAMIAASYALYTVFYNVWAAIAFGLVWGLMIFNLDRYIVSSMKKKGKWFQDFGMAIPRIVLAVIISIVIAKPLELKIFSSEIQAELISMQQETRKLHEDKLKLRFDADLKKVEEEIDDINGELRRLRNQKDILYAQALGEADGTGGSKIRNMGPIYKAKMQTAKASEDEFNLRKAELDPILAEKEARKKTILESRDSELLALEKAALNGFASRIEALDRISSKSNAVFMASIFIMLLFIAIETAPLFVKLISDRSPYDYVLNKIENEVEMDHKEHTMLRKLEAQTKTEFASKTKLHRNAAEIEAENELFTHAIKSEVEQLKQNTGGLKDYLKKGRILSNS
ncbi:MAG: DUF4407 domain-containing protein [Saprospiraceae bacterium]|nr:DUF4407 domain-containing protein [Saprospiraceae bacterium]